MEIISSQNQRIKHLRKLLENKNYRYSCREYVIESVRSLDNVKKVNELFVRTDVKAPAVSYDRIYSVSESVFNKISDTETSQGVIAVAPLRILDAPAINKHKRYILLDKLQDPGNMGTIIRTALAFNITGIIITHGCVDPFSPKVVRSAMGAQEHIDIIKIGDISQLKNYNVIAADKYGSSIKDFKWPDSYILVIGNEGAGLSRDVKSICRQAVSVPMSDSVESLNAAIAAAIILYNSKNN